MGYNTKSSSLSSSFSDTSTSSSSSRNRDLPLDVFNSSFASSSSTVCAEFASGFTSAAADRWWKTNDTDFTTSQAWLRTVSGRPLLLAQWNHCDRSDVQSDSSGGSFTWILLTQRLHLNLKDVGIVWLIDRHCWPVLCMKLTWHACRTRSSPRCGKDRADRLWWNAARRLRCCPPLHWTGLFCASVVEISSPQCCQSTNIKKKT